MDKYVKPVGITPSQPRFTLMVREADLRAGYLPKARRYLAAEQQQAHRAAAEAVGCRLQCNSAQEILTGMPRAGALFATRHELAERA